MAESQEQVMERNDHNPQLREDVRVEPAVGLLELGSVARGVEVLALGARVTARSIRVEGALPVLL